MQPFSEADRRLDVVCLSHLRWDFVYQRPQHLMSRFARHARVFFFEEPIWDDRVDGPARLEVGERSEGVRVAVPHLPHGLSPEAAEEAQRDLLRRLLEDHGVTDYVLWYYTPMALGFSSGLAPAAVVYDCMDELSLFRGAPPALLERESRLLALADLVFTGGQSLYEAKRDRHPARPRLPQQRRRPTISAAPGLPSLSPQTRRGSPGRASATSG